MQNVAELSSTKEKRTRNPASTDCPKCNSSDTRLSEMVNSEGTSTETFAADSYTFTKYCGFDKKIAVNL